MSPISPLGATLGELELRDFGEWFDLVRPNDLTRRRQLTKKLNMKRERKKKERKKRFTRGQKVHINKLRVLSLSLLGREIYSRHWEIGKCADVITGDSRCIPTRGTRHFFDLCQSLPRSQINFRWWWWCNRLEEILSFLTCPHRHRPKKCMSLLWLGLNLIVEK